MSKSGIIFFKKGLFGQKVYKVGFESVIGIYKYRTKLLNPIKFRVTYRLNSALDNRDVLVLAYQVLREGKLENCRIYFKASAEMVDMLKFYLPEKVLIEEDGVFLKML